MNLRITKGSLCWIFTLIQVCLPFGNQADQLELANGDRYIGKVIGVTETNVTLRSEINGLMQLPRSKVTAITFGDKLVGSTVASLSVATPVPLARPANASAASPLAPAPKPAPKDLAAEIKAQGIDPKSIKQVQEQILGAASPEVTSKFNEMVSGLIVGRLSMDDIRAQARSSVKELQAAKTELGEEFGTVLDGYLNILQGFLGETESDESAVTKSNAKPKGAPAQAQKAEADEDE